MKKFHVKEYNKLCSEFMGLIPLTKPYLGAYTTNNSTEKMLSSFLELVTSDMIEESWYVYPKFDSDWNWITEVTTKIETLHPNYHSKLICSVNGVYVQEFWTREGIKGWGQSKDKKEAVVQAIWEFLNWYKEQKS